MYYKENDILKLIFTRYSKTLLIRQCFTIRTTYIFRIIENRVYEIICIAKAVIRGMITVPLFIGENCFLTTVYTDTHTWRVQSTPQRGVPALCTVAYPMRVIFIL